MTASTNTVRVGVVGSGGFADFCHIPGLKSHPSAEVTAVCGRRREPAAALAAKHGIPHVFTDVGEMVRSGTVDAVTIVTPNDAHCDAAVTALQGGLPVLCEKPLAVDADQARRMVEAAEAAGRVNMVCFTFRYLHGLRTMRKMLAAGAIGRPYYVRLWSREYRMVGPQAVGGWRQERARAGTGVLGDLGSHMLDVTRYLLGPVAGVCGQMIHVPRTLRTADGGTMNPDVDDVTAFLFRTESGVPGDLFASWATPTYDRRTVEVVGEEGALMCHLTRGEDEKLRLTKPGKAIRDGEDVPLPPEADPSAPSGLGRMMRSFVDAVRRGGKGEHDADFRDGLAAQLTVDAVVRSAAGGRWEPVGK